MSEQSDLLATVGQWLWWVPGWPRVGLGDGSRTWVREPRHARLGRPMAICLLEFPQPASSSDG